MKSITLTKKELIFLVAAFLFMVLLSVTVYFMMYYPSTTAVASVEQSITNEEKLVSVLESKAAAQDVSFSEDSTALQQQIPVKPLVEQIILQIERAEVIADVKVKSTTFSDEAYTPTVATADTEEGEESTEVEESETTSEDAPETTAVPAAMQRIVSTLEVEAPSFFELQDFLQEIEKLERMHVITNLSFSGQEEIQALGDTTSPVTVSVVMAAYYLPELTDLLEQVPQLDTPLPAKKKSPLPTLKSGEDTDEDEADETP